MTDGGRISAWSPAAWGITVMLALTAGPVEAQAPLFLVNPETRVAVVGFDFPEGRSLDVDLLRRQVALTGPTSGQRVQRALAFLPLVGPPGLQSFSPPELFRDRERLTRYYRDEGFPDVRVEYRVSLDTVPNTVDIIFVVHEGNPVVLKTVSVVGANGGAFGDDLPAGPRRDWPALLARLQKEAGRRLSSSRRLRIQNEIASWLQNRGYPFPQLDEEEEVEQERGRLTITVRPGPRMRVAVVRVEGNNRIPDGVLRREVPLRPGDWYSRAKLADGQTQIMGIDMVRLAVVGTERDLQRDSLVNVGIQVDEGKLHLLSGRLGYSTQAGISGDLSWNHRDFLGGARVLNLTAVAQTGLLGAENPVTKRYGASALLRQPYFFDRRLEGLLRPFVDYRSDLRDRSVETGTEGSVLFSRGPNRHVTLRYTISYRNILSARAAGPIGQGEDLVDLILSVDSLNLNRRTSSLVLSSQWGRPADMTRLLRGWGVSGSVEIAGPPKLSTVEYGKLLAQAGGDLPLSHGVLLSGRIGVGRVFPYGASVPEADGSDRLEVYLKLRDAILTAGGSQDVRGWGNELLGPKIPDLTSVGDSTVSARGSYIPLGGLARWTASIQVGVPLPFLGRPHGIHAFLDGGRVWTPDERYLPSDVPLIPGQAGTHGRFGTGVGVLFASPVGPVQVDLGFKLNPSVLDVRDPRKVADALAHGESLTETVPVTPLRRWHLHLSIGR
jgi:outer membrane protein insertion porin family